MAERPTAGGFFSDRAIKRESAEGKAQKGRSSFGHPEVAKKRSKRDAILNALLTVGPAVSASAQASAQGINPVLAGLTGISASIQAPTMDDIRQAKAVEEAKAKMAMFEAMPTSEVSPELASRFPALADVPIGHARGLTPILTAADNHEKWLIQLEETLPMNPAQETAVVKMFKKTITQDEISGKSYKEAIEYGLAKAGLTKQLAATEHAEGTLQLGKDTLKQRGETAFAGRNMQWAIANLRARTTSSGGDADFTSEQFDKTIRSANTMMNQASKGLVNSEGKFIGNMTGLEDFTRLQAETFVSAAKGRVGTMKNYGEGVEVYMAARGMALNMPINVEVKRDKRTGMIIDEGLLKSADAVKREMINKEMPPVLTEQGVYASYVKHVPSEVAKKKARGQSEERVRAWASDQLTKNMLVNGNKIGIPFPPISSERHKSLVDQVMEAYN